MDVLVTGSKGFIGKHLVESLKLIKDINIYEFNSEDKIKDLYDKLSKSDLVYCLAATNRSKSIKAFKTNNVDLIENICEFIKKNSLRTSIVFTSSIHAGKETPYGKTKKQAESILRNFEKLTSANVSILRLPGVFGKSSKPNYNTVVATFCNNIVKNLPSKIDNKNSRIKLAYIDDVVDILLNFINQKKFSTKTSVKIPNFNVTVGALYSKLANLYANRNSLDVINTSDKFEKYLYSTLISFLPESNFKFPMKVNDDVRGRFAEFIRSKENGQVSYFTINPGFSRGDHFHHTKVERFLVLRGNAEFVYKNIFSGKKVTFKIHAQSSSIIETIPGWSHKIRNIGDEEVIILVWANENFDHENPDTFEYKI